MTTYEILNLAVQIITALFIAGGLVYAALQIRLLTQQIEVSKTSHNDNHDWNRRISAQNALLESNNNIMTDALQREFDFLNKQQPIPIAEIQRVFNEKPEVQVHCLKLLNQYEMFALGIHNGVYDEELIKLTRRGSMERAYTAFEEYIKFRRNEVGKTPYGSFEALLMKWRREDKGGSVINPTGRV